MNICCINCPPLIIVYLEPLYKWLWLHKSKLRLKSSACFIVSLVERISAPDRAQIILSDGYIVKGAKESVVSRCFYLCMYTCCICVVANIFCIFVHHSSFWGLYLRRHLKLVFAAGVLLFLPPPCLSYLCSFAATMYLFLDVIVSEHNCKNGTLITILVLRPFTPFPVA